MKDIFNITDIRANPFKRDTTLYEPVADPGAVILEWDPEKQSYGKHARRMNDLTKLAALQKEVIQRVLDRSIEKSVHPKKPHLTVVK